MREHTEDQLRLLQDYSRRIRQYNISFYHEDLKQEQLDYIFLHTEIKGNNFICPISVKKNDIEKEADTFASNLLMPTEELNKRVDFYANKDGKVGYVVEPQPVKIADAICDFYDNDRKEFFENNVIEEKKKYEWSKMSETIKKLYDDVSK